MTEQEKSRWIAIGRIPSGLFIVTAKKGDEQTAFLASWVQQAAFEPPLLSLAVRKGRPIEKLLAPGSVFVVHVCGKQNSDMIKHYLKNFELDKNAFADFETIEGVTGAPILTAALACIECEYYDRADAGDHVIVLGKVVEGRVLHPDDEPILHTRPTGRHY